MLFQSWLHLKNKLWLFKVYRWLVLTLGLLNRNPWEYGRAPLLVKRLPRWLWYRTGIGNHCCRMGAFLHLTSLRQGLLTPTGLWSSSYVTSQKTKIQLPGVKATLFLSVHEPWTSKMFKLGLEKAEEPEIKLPTSTGSSKKQESSRKISTALLTMPKPLTVWITTNSRKFFKRWEYQTTWPASWEICMQVRKQQLELDME